MILNQVKWGNSCSTLNYLLIKMSYQQLFFSVLSNQIAADVIFPYLPQLQFSVLWTATIPADVKYTIPRIPISDKWFFIDF